MKSFVLKRHKPSGNKPVSLTYQTNDMAKEVKLNTKNQVLNNNVNDALDYIIGKKAIYTLLNTQSGNRFTYKTYEKKSMPGILLVSLLSGPDNTSNYTYLGFINKRNWIFKSSDKSTITPDAQSFQVFNYVYNRLRANTLPDFISVYHHGKCSRCGRTLTVPTSIESGIGPECIKLRGMGK